MTIYPGHRNIRKRRKQIVEPPLRPGISIGVEGYDVLDESERAGNYTLRYRGIPKASASVVGVMDADGVMEAFAKAAEKDAEVRRLYDAEGRFLSRGNRRDAAAVARTRIIFRAAYDAAIREAMGITPAELAEEAMS